MRSVRAALLGIACILCIGCTKTTTVRQARSTYEMRRVIVDTAPAPGKTQPRHRWVKTVTGTKTVKHRETRFNLGMTLLWTLTIAVTSLSVLASGNR